MTVVCIKVADRKFLDYADEPCVLFLYGMDDEIVNTCIYWNVIIPEVQSWRQLMLDDPFNEEKEKYKYIAVVQDGALRQIRAIENHLHPWSEEHDQNIIFGKYAAGGSIYQSPNDKGKMHSMLHQLFKSSKFRYEDFVGPDTGRWQYLKNIMKNALDSSSFKTIWKCLCHAPQFLDKAFTRSNIQTAFDLSGIYSRSAGKFNETTIMSSLAQFINRR
jgi:hypothetical protein